MGISSLLKVLTNSTRSAHISEFENTYVAIDAYCWLHKGIYCCSVELAMGKPTTKYVTYCMRYIDMLLHFKVKPILVFDGRSLSSKEETDKKRKEGRQRKYKKGIELIRAGQLEEGRRLLGESVEVTHDLVKNLMKECRELNIDCIVAPFEADAQLAFFSLRNIVTCIVTEDSDLLAYGCEKVMFKMNTSGVGELIEKSQLYLSLGVDQENFSEEKFRYMCILTGCDYLPSLNSIGPMSALKFVKMIDDRDIYEVLPKLPIYLNKTKIVVTPEYKRGFKIADNTFKYQLVYDPFERKQVPLRPVENEDEIVGEKLPEDVAFQLALGNIDPETMKTVGDFDPDKLGTGFDILWRTEHMSNPPQRKPVANLKYSITEAKKRQREVSSVGNDFKKARIPYNLTAFKNLSLKETVNKVPKTGFLFEPKSTSSKKNNSKVTDASQMLQSRYFQSKAQSERDKKETNVKQKDESYEDYLRRLYDEYFPLDGSESKGVKTKQKNEFCCDEASQQEGSLCRSCSKCSECCKCNSSNEKISGTQKLNNCIKEFEEHKKKKQEIRSNHFLLDEIYKEDDEELENEKSKTISPKQDSKKERIETEGKQRRESSSNEKTDLNISKISLNLDDSISLLTEESPVLVEIKEGNKEINTEEIFLDENIDSSERSPSPVFKVNRGSKISVNSCRSENLDTTATPTSVYFSSPSSGGLDTTVPLKSVKATPLTSCKKTGSSAKGICKSAPSKFRLQNTSKSSTVNRTLFQFGFQKKKA